MSATLGAYYDSSGTTALTGSGSAVVTAIYATSCERHHLRLFNTGTTDLFYSVDGTVWNYVAASSAVVDDFVNSTGSGFKTGVSLMGNGSGFSGVFVSIW